MSEIPTDSAEHVITIDPDPNDGTLQDAIHVVTDKVLKFAMDAEGKVILSGGLMNPPGGLGGGGGMLFQSEPVEIAFDDPEINNGIPFGFPARTIPLFWVVEVVEPFVDSGGWAQILFADQNGGVLSKQMPIFDPGFWPSVIDGNTSGTGATFTSFYATFSEAPFTAGRVRVSVLYADPSASGGGGDGGAASGSGLRVVAFPGEADLSGKTTLYFDAAQFELTDFAMIGDPTGVGIAVSGLSGGGVALPAHRTLEPKRASDSHWRLTYPVDGPNDGDFKISFDGDTTAAIPYSCTGAEVLAALEALPGISGNLALTSDPDTWISSGIDILCIGSFVGQRVEAPTVVEDTTGAALFFGILNPGSADDPTTAKDGQLAFWGDQAQSISVYDEVENKWRMFHSEVEVHRVRGVIPNADFMQANLQPCPIGPVPELDEIVVPHRFMIDYRPPEGNYPYSFFGDMILGNLRIFTDGDLTAGWLWGKPDVLGSGAVTHVFWNKTTTFYMDHQRMAGSPLALRTSNAPLGGDADIGWILDYEIQKVG